jgi:hypothetical protein
MKLSLLIFIIGVLFITAGYTQQLDPGCKKGNEVRIVPRNVYDQVIADSTLFK